MTDPLVATFSIVARDSETGDLGVAVASKFLAVGSVVPTARAGIGAIATQALANTSYGERAMEMLAAGSSVQDCAREFGNTDDGFQSRQFGIVSAKGDSVTHTGNECLSWAGGVSGPDFAAQGNILSGPEVVDALVNTWTTSSAPFPEKLFQALSAADEAGGDSRGRQSAALYVVGDSKGYGGNNDRWIDLRVDDHPDPVRELGRLLEMFRLLLDKPAARPRELIREEIAWLQEQLDLPASGNWDDATEAALQRVYGIENLEERWHGGPHIDPQAWNHLRRLFAPSGH